MNKLYALNLSAWETRGHWRAFLPQLPQARQEKVMTLRREADQMRSVGAGRLLQYALEQSGVPAEAQVFSQTSSGKPYLINQADVHFSVSHCGHWVVCAVSDQPVGVDVELPRCTMTLARRFFRPEELEALPLPEELALQRLWVAKEAFVKALGGGLTIPLDSFTVRLQETQAILEQTLSPLPYRLWEYGLEDYRICLCTVGDQPPLQTVEL